MRNESITQLFRGLRLFAILACLTLGVARAPHGADQDMFSVYDLNIDGLTLGVMSGDFNGDKAGDVAVVYYPWQNEDDRRFIAVFFQTNGAYVRQPNALVQLPGPLTQFQVVDLENDGLAEILAVDDAGAQVIRYSRDKGFAPPARVIRRESSYNAGKFHGCIVANAAFDILSPAGREIAMPTTDGVALFKLGAKGSYALSGELALAGAGESVQPRTDIFARRHTGAYIYEPTVLRVADANGDARPDIYATQGDRVAQFLQDDAGAFSRVADRVVKLARFGSREGIMVEWADLNGDRKLDVVCGRMSGGVAEAEMSVDVYLADATGLINKTPNKTITLSQARSEIFVADVSGDRAPELILATVELGSLATVKMLMQQKGAMHLLVYPLAGGLPQERSPVRVKLEFSLSLANAAPEQEVALCLDGDYNGDGRMDVAFSNGAGAVQIYPGQAQGYIASEPLVEVLLPDVTDILCAELNGDGRSDALVERPAEKNSRVTVLMSRRGTR